MSTITSGMAVHAVATYRCSTTPSDVRIVDWTTACGVQGRIVGPGRFGRALDAHRRMLCRACYLGGNHHMYHPDPVEVTS